MTKRASLCCAVTLFAVVGCKDRKLADDFKWMDNTYNVHSTIGHGRSGWYVHSSNGETERLASGTIDSLKNDGCDFEFHSEDDPTDKVHTELVTSTTLKVNLRDIDPDSVNVRIFSHFGGFNCADYTPQQIESMQMNCDYAQMRAFTRNENPVVQEDFHMIYPKITGKDHESTSNSKGPEVYLGFDNPEYAKKFAGVFQDAVRRCGGTKGAAS